MVNCQKNYFAFSFVQRTHLNLFHDFEIDTGGQVQIAVLLCNTKVGNK